MFNVFFKSFTERKKVNPKQVKIIFDTLLIDVPVNSTGFNRDFISSIGHTRVAAVLNQTLLHRDCWADPETG